MRRYGYIPVSKRQKGYAPRGRQRLGALGHEAPRVTRRTIKSAEEGPEDRARWSTRDPGPASDIAQPSIPEPNAEHAGSERCPTEPIATAVPHPRKALPFGTPESRARSRSLLLGTSPAVDRSAAYAAYEHLNLSDWSASAPTDEVENGPVDRILNLMEDGEPDAESSRQFLGLDSWLDHLSPEDELEIDSILQLVEGPCLGERARTYKLEREARKAREAEAAAAEAERERQAEHASRAGHAARTEVVERRREAQALVVERRELRSARRAAKERGKAARADARRLAAEARRAAAEERERGKARRAAAAAESRRAAAAERERGKARKAAAVAEARRAAAVERKREAAKRARERARKAAVAEAERKREAAKRAREKARKAAAAEAERKRKAAVEELRETARKAVAAVEARQAAEAERKREALAKRVREKARNAAAAAAAAEARQAAEEERKLKATAAEARRAAAAERAREKARQAAERERRAREAAAERMRAEAVERQAVEDERRRRALAEAEAAEAAKAASALKMAEAERERLARKAIERQAFASFPEVRLERYYRFLCEFIDDPQPVAAAEFAWGSAQGFKNPHQDLSVVIPDDPAETNRLRARAHAERHLLRQIGAIHGADWNVGLEWVSSLTAEGGLERVRSWLYERSGAILAEISNGRSSKAAAMFVWAHSAVVTELAHLRDEAKRERIARRATGEADRKAARAENAERRRKDGEAERERRVNAAAAGAAERLRIAEEVRRAEERDGSDPDAEVAAAVLRMISVPGVGKRPPRVSPGSLIPLHSAHGQGDRLLGDSYWAKVRVELGAGETGTPRSRGGPAKPGVGTDAGVPTLVGAAHPGMASSMRSVFPTAGTPDLQALASRLARLGEKGARDTLLAQFRQSFPEARRRRGISRTDPEFSDIVAAMMSSGLPEMRFLLLHKSFPGVAMIDVRCPRPQLVASWSRCIAAARSHLPPERRPPSPALMDEVANLRLGLRISDLTRCLHGLDLHVVIGRTE